MRWARATAPTPRSAARCSSIVRNVGGGIPGAHRPRDAGQSGQVHVLLRRGRERSGVGAAGAAPRHRGRQERRHAVPWRGRARLHRPEVAHAGGAGALAGDGPVRRRPSRSWCAPATRCWCCRPSTTGSSRTAAGTRRRIEDALYEALKRPGKRPGLRRPERRRGRAAAVRRQDDGQVRSAARRRADRSRRRPGRAILGHHRRLARPARPRGMPGRHPRDSLGRLSMTIVESCAIPPPRPRRPAAPASRRRPRSTARPWR